MAEVKSISYTESQIITSIVNGDTALYEIIIRRFNSYLYKIGRSYGYSHEDTEDLMQETYLSAFSALSKFEGRSSFKTWLVKIMLNHCYQAKLKGSYSEIKQTHLKEEVIPMFSNQMDSDKNLLNKELNLIVENALLQLPEQYRLVFSLRELNGMNVSETSEALNISPVNVKVRLSRAKSMLRSVIEKMYSPEEIFDFNLMYCNKVVDTVMSRLIKKDAQLK
jgi:RNA polymerase sigma factor (sigma-70 family)